MEDDEEDLESDDDAQGAMSYFIQKTKSKQQYRKKDYKLPKKFKVMNSYGAEQNPGQGIGM